MTTRSPSHQATALKQRCRTYVLADGWKGNPYRDNHERLANDPSWDFFSIGCGGHDIMINESEYLVDTLLRAD